jgi:hypothetical protein
LLSYLALPYVNRHINVIIIIIIIIIIIGNVIVSVDRLCGLVATVLDYRSGGPGSIPGTTRKKISGSGTGCTQPRAT